MFHDSYGLLDLYWALNIVYLHCVSEPLFAVSLQCSLASSFTLLRTLSVFEFLAKLRVATQLHCYGQASKGSNLLKPVWGCKWSECLSLTVRLVGFRDARM